MKNYNKHKQSRCVACSHDGSFYPLDIDHLLTQKARPDLRNNPSNCITLCRKCHQLKGMNGISYMADKYLGVMSFLLANKWYKCELTNRWRLDLTGEEDI